MRVPGRNGKAERKLADLEEKVASLRAKPLTAIPLDQAGIERLAQSAAHMALESVVERMAAGELYPSIDDTVKLVKAAVISGTIEPVADDEVSDEELDGLIRRAVLRLGAVDGGAE